MASESASELDALRTTIRAFVGERDWNQFHTPKNLVMALAVEVSELMEHFQWRCCITATRRLPGRRETPAG